MPLISSEEIAALSLQLPVPLTQHPAAVYLGSLSEGSKRTMGSSLNAIAHLLTDGQCDAMTLDWSKLRYRHTAAIRTALAQRLEPATVNKMLVALRRVLKEAYRLDLMDANDCAKATDLKSLRTSGALRGRALSREEINRLVESCISLSAIDLRDGAVIAILRGGGIRRDELVKLTTDDLDLCDGELIVRRGKGGKQRTVYLNEEALTFVKNWLKIRGDAPGALICPVTKGNRVIVRHFASDGDGIYKLLKRRAEKAGVVDFSPHDFRRTFCSELLDDEDLFTVQDLAGHVSSVTTKKYDRRGEARKRKAVKKLKLR
ncbi:MAG: site-specific integrase [Prochloraceae cyanobacterium]|nr:site-specific integrase [Prochloraceae cyanobacterium]